MKLTIYRFDSISLGKAFLEELIALGYKLDKSMGFDSKYVNEAECVAESIQVNSRGIAIVHNHKCDHIGFNFQLETQWKEALEHAKQQIQPEFKKGDWVTIVEAAPHRWSSDQEGNTFRLTSGAPFYATGQTGKTYGLVDCKLRKATKEEIKYTLIKEAEKRGFKKGVSFKKPAAYINKCQTAKGRIYEIDGSSFNYSTYKDFLTLGTKTIYEQGTWGEIIKNPDFFGYETNKKGGGFIHIGCSRYHISDLEKLYRDLLNLDDSIAIKELREELSKIL